MAEWRIEASRHSLMNSTNKPILMFFLVATAIAMNCPQRFWGLDLCFTAGSLILVTFLIVKNIREEKSANSTAGIEESKLQVRERVLRFSVQHSLALRYLMFIAITFLLEGSVFAKHGYLVIESSGLATLITYLHKLGILFVLYRLVEPKDRQDLYGLFFLVVTSICGGWRFATEAACLFLVVLLGRWSKNSRIASAFLYVLCIAPMLGMMAVCSYGEGAGAILHPEPFRTMDGIYYLTKSYQGVTLYREVELFPHVYMRKPIDYKTTGWPSWAHIRKISEGKYDIVVSEPPPEFFK